MKEILLQRLRGYLERIDKRWLLAAAVLLWLHGVTVGMVFEGQKGLLNRFLWTFVLAIAPLWMLAQNKSWTRLAVALSYFELNLGHEILPQWKKLHIHNPATQTWLYYEAEKVPDMVILVLLSSAFVLAMTRRSRLQIFTRFFIVYGTLCILRSVTVISTSLPDSAEKCRLLTPTGNLLSGAHGWESITLREVMIRSLKLLMPVGEVTCGDMVFSGHSMLMVLCAMTWHTYYKWVPRSINPVKVTVWVITLFGLLAIVMVRMHYTIDVVLALYFTVTIWSSYHRIANDVKIGHRFSSVWIIDAILIYPAIEWLEKVDDEDEEDVDVKEQDAARPPENSIQARRMEISDAHADFMDDPFEVNEGRMESNHGPKDEPFCTKRRRSSRFTSTTNSTTKEGKRIATSTSFDIISEEEIDEEQEEHKEQEEIDEEQEQEEKVVLLRLQRKKTFKSTASSIQQSSISTSPLTSTKPKQRFAPSSSSSSSSSSFLDAPRRITRSQSDRRKDQQQAHW